LDFQKVQLFPSNHIKTILFDLDGTLKVYLPEGGEVVADYATSLGLSVSGEDRLRAMRWEHYYWAGSPELEQDQGAAQDEQAMWTIYSRRQLIALGTAPGQAQELAPKIQAYMYANHRPEERVPDQLVEALQTLKTAGFTLGVLSNRTRPFGPELDALGLSPYLDFAMAAGEVNLWKPDPAIFYHALDRAKSNPQESVYVGDNYFADVVGARRAGLRPVLFDPRGLYPEADCSTIRHYGQLIPALQGF
jgi:putative hydrolase of the HAD superfamily